LEKQDAQTSVLIDVPLERVQSVCMIVADMTQNNSTVQYFYPQLLSKEWCIVFSQNHSSSELLTMNKGCLTRMWGVAATAGPTSAI
jgi:hypothetical protein